MNSKDVTTCSNLVSDEEIITPRDLCRRFEKQTHRSLYATYSASQIEQTLSKHPHLFKILYENGDIYSLQKVKKKYRNLFNEVKVKNIPAEFDIKKALAEIGIIDFFQYNPENKEALVDYHNQNDALEVIRRYDGFRIADHVLTVELRNLTTQQLQDRLNRPAKSATRVCASRLPENITLLADEFQKWGIVLDLHRAEDYYFVEYSTQEECQRAIVEMNGYKQNKYDSRLIVARASARRDGRDLLDNTKRHITQYKSGVEESSVMGIDYSKLDKLIIWSMLEEIERYEKLTGE